MQKNAEKCRKMQKNAEKCRKMQKNAEKCRKMQKNAEKCRKMQKNAEKCGKCRKMQKNADKCRQMQTNAEKCRQMQKNADKCRQMQKMQKNAEKCSSQVAYWRISERLVSFWQVRRPSKLLGTGDVSCHQIWTLRVGRKILDSLNGHRRRVKELMDKTRKNNRRNKNLKFV